MPDVRCSTDSIKLLNQLSLRAAKTFNHVALQLRIPGPGTAGCASGELFGGLLEDNFVGRVTPRRAGGAGGRFRVKIDDVLRNGDVRTCGGGRYGSPSR